MERAAKIGAITMKLRTKVLLFLLALTVATACNGDRLFEEFRGMQDLQWGVEDTVSFEVAEVDPNLSPTFIAVRYNDRYEFHNLYVRYLLKDSIGTVLADSLINVYLFDPKTGKPLGSGYGNVYTKYDELPPLQVAPSDKYRFEFIQYMRTDTLGGVEAVGLRINKSKVD